MQGISIFCINGFNVDRYSWTEGRIYKLYLSSCIQVTADLSTFHVTVSVSYETFMRHFQILDERFIKDAY